MAQCNECGDEVDLPYTCTYCDRHYCADHRLPEKHVCVPGRGTDEGVFASRSPSTLDKETSALSDRRSESTSPDHRPTAPETETRPTGSRAYRSKSSDYRVDPTRGDDSPPVETKPTDGRDGDKRSRLVRRGIKAGKSVLRAPIRLARRVVNPAVVFLVIVGIVLVGGTVGTGVPAVDDTIDDARESVAGLVENATHPSTRAVSSGEPSGGSPRTAGASDGSIATAAIEREIHEAVNERRRAAGVSSLEFDTGLRRVARYHSTQMATKDFFAHTSPTGDSFVDRYERFDYECRVPTGPNEYAAGGENIAFTYASSDVLRDTGGVVNYRGNETRIARGIVDQWMNSSGHRDNMLQPAWRNEGVGVALAEDDGKTRVYATQNFC